MKNILVVDIGGSHVKLMISRSEKRKFDSGTKLSPRQLTAKIKETAEGWDYDRVSIGFPSPMKNGHILNDPKHLSTGWVGWDFRKHLGKPTRLINDAAMQALGSYHGQRMLFLGLGTGLGSTLVWGSNILPLELGDLPYPGVNRIEEILGKEGMAELGRKTWEREMWSIVTQLKKCFVADYVVLGGGNAKLLQNPPEGFELGSNRNAYLGGSRLWLINQRTRRPQWNVIG